MWIRDSFNALNLAKLKEMCQSRDVDMKGTKDVVIRNLITWRGKQRDGAATVCLDLHGPDGTGAAVPSPSRVLSASESCQANESDESDDDGEDVDVEEVLHKSCLLYTSPSPRDS
eukprot:TRINITY_DN21596_c0_g1_i1.p2 TRINITY_DN21596_c0_g1~~TRINITY_DN21596_c0_g1_i1.p2  ORF type:complete len:115 (-),score=28.47 TRINITY_DN21596_c0_g1_i1:61-405(-)